MAEVTEIDVSQGNGAPAAAFFDLDGTLIVGQTQAMLVRFLRGRGAVGLPFVTGAAAWFVAYKAGLLKAAKAAGWPVYP